MDSRIEIADPWTRFEERTPDQSCFLWVAFPNGQVCEAYWCTDATDEFEDMPRPQITYCGPHLGQEQPSHWKPQARPRHPEVRRDDV